MAAVTYDYYANTYMGDPSVTEADFPRYEARAEDAINALIRYRAVPPQWQELYKKAICAQIDYYGQYGIEMASSGMMENSFTVGKVSVSGGGRDSRAVSGGGTMISPQALSYLEQTGLMSPTVPVCGGGWI